MIEAWAPPQVYTAEQALMATLDKGELMARAVEGLTAVATARLAEFGGDRVVALVGPGNNGADALFATARLAAAGVNAAALHTERVHPRARDAALAAGVVLHADDATSDTALHEVLGLADLVLDGILGIGGRGGLPPWAVRWVDAIADHSYVIAVDTPSGHPPGGGPLERDGVMADETVTFSVAKPVHVLPPTEQACGRLTVVDIGLTVEAPPDVCRLTHDDVATAWPVPGAGDDKYSRGVLGIVAGSRAYPGAAVLVTTAAIEAGAGMVRYVGPDAAWALVALHAPEAVPGSGRVQAWAVGPGLDPAAEDAESRVQLERARTVLAEDVPVLVDAGGLDLLDTDLLASRAGRPTLLTPHAGECARLLSRLTGVAVQRAHVAADPAKAARRLAEVTGATILLKGSTTVVAEPSGRLWSQADAPAWLATAGAGDVLSGLVGTLLAAGLPPGPAGALGALVHGVAADLATPGGPVRALRVAHSIPTAVATLCSRGAPRSQQTS